MSQAMMDHGGTGERAKTAHFDRYTTESWNAPCVKSLSARQTVAGTRLGLS